MSILEIAQTSQQLAKRLVELCSVGKFNEAQDELFADNAISIEPEHSLQPLANGLESIKKKGQEFQSAIEENHGGYINQPIVAGNHFAVTMGIDVTMKDGNRMKMDEVVVYKVADGKIVSEQFFY